MVDYRRKIYIAEKEEEEGDSRGRERQSHFLDAGFTTALTPVAPPKWDTHSRELWNSLKQCDAGGTVGGGAAETLSLSLSLRIRCQS